MPNTNTSIGKHRMKMAEARQRKKETETKNRNLLQTIGLQGMSTQQNRLIFTLPTVAAVQWTTAAKTAIIVEIPLEQLRDKHGFTANV